MNANRWAFLLVILMACTDQPQNSPEDNPPTTAKAADSKTSGQTQKNNIDTLTFKEVRSEGENFLFVASNPEEEKLFFYDSIREKELTRGDIIEVQWKSSGAAADDAIHVKKIKDGPVSDFRKKHPQAIKMLTEQPVNDWNPYHDDLYLAVEYYLAQTKNPVLQQIMKTSFSEIIFSAEEKVRDGRYYTIVGIAQNFEHRLNTVQWLFFDQENHKLYEYNLPNDKLIEVK